MGDDDQTTNANPWADFKPTGSSARFQAASDRRIISTRPNVSTPPPVAAPVDPLPQQNPPEQTREAANPFASLDDQPVAAQPAMPAARPMPQSDLPQQGLSPDSLNLNQPTVASAPPTNQVSPQPIPQPQFEVINPPTQTANLPQQQTFSEPPQAAPTAEPIANNNMVPVMDPNLGPSQQQPQFQQPQPNPVAQAAPQNFNSIAWPGESSGLDSFSTNPSLTATQAESPIATQPQPQPQVSVQNSAPINSQFGAAPGPSELNHPPADTVVEAKPKKVSKIKTLISKLKMPKLNIKKVLLILAGLLILGGISFVIIKFSVGKNKPSQASLSAEQQATQEIIALAQQNKSDEIINKYVRASNKEGFPTDQFKTNIKTFSEASSSKPSYMSENSGKVIVRPDTAPSDMHVYIYTTNYKGYKGKIYIRVDMFKDATDGKWYLYAFAYNSNELKPDIVSN